MATFDECRAAVERLAERLTSVDDDERRKHAFDRSLSCYIPDLDTTFCGRLEDGHIHDIRTEGAQPAQIKLTADSDDLVAMTDGHLSLGQAWRSGKLKVQASVLDLIKLKSLI